MPHSTWAPFVVIQPSTQPATVNGIKAQKVKYIATVKAEVRTSGDLLDAWAIRRKDL